MKALKLYQRQGGVFHLLRREVMRMRLTFHIRKWTVTIIVRETSHKKAKTRNGRKTTATPLK